MNFGQEEGRNGAATSGQYHVLLPDGRTQTVTYNVGDAYTGYVADVKYSGKFFYKVVHSCYWNHPNIRDLFFYEIFVLTFFF